LLPYWQERIQQGNLRAQRRRLLALIRNRAKRAGT